MTSATMSSNSRDEGRIRRRRPRSAASCGRITVLNQSSLARTRCTLTPLMSAAPLPLSSNCCHLSIMLAGACPAPVAPSASNGAKFRHLCKIVCSDRISPAEAREPNGQAGRNRVAPARLPVARQLAFRQASMGEATPAGIAARWCLAGVCRLVPDQAEWPCFSPSGKATRGALRKFQASYPHLLASPYAFLYAAPTGDRCGRGETGRRARFRFWYRKMWGFESLRPHQCARLVSCQAPPEFS